MASMQDRVLIPVDFTKESMAMFDCALELKELGLKHLTLLHVQQKGQELDKEQTQKFDEMEQKMNAAGIDSRAIIRDGDPVQAIVDEADKEDVDMVVMASGGKGRAEEFFVGSVSFGVVRRTSKPVLLDKYPMMPDGAVRACRIGPTLFRNALVAVELPMCSGNLEAFFSDLCERGLNGATLLHVVDSDRYKMSDDKRFRDVKKFLEDMKSRITSHKCEIKTHVHYGTAAYNVLEVAREIDASIIVVGTKQKSYLRGLTIGSVSEEVVRRASIPVLVVPC
ncbi:MAG TPA: universal stress protein [Methanomassiliicoccales archaeon]|nr:universal stress protein [Methanomassiliicoccales archaeon]